jgi:hypothetical protein
MKPITRLLPAVVALALAGRASALVIVDYAFDDTNSTFSISSPVQASTPPGTFGGQIRVAYTSDSQGEIANGPATLEILNLDANLDVHSSFLNASFTLTGPTSAHLTDAVDGVLTGSQLDFGNATGSFHAFGSITCSGAPCAYLNFPSDTAVPFDGAGSAPLPVLTLGSIHGTLTGLTFMVGNVSIVASLTINAQEVPEPAAAALAAGAGAALLLAARRRAA